MDVRTIGQEEAPAAVATIALAFAADPATRWTWPECRQFLDAMPGFAIQAGSSPPIVPMLRRPR